MKNRHSSDVRLCLSAVMVVIVRDCCRSQALKNEMRDKLIALITYHSLGVHSVVDKTLCSYELLVGKQSTSAAFGR